MYLLMIGMVPKSKRSLKNNGNRMIDSIMDINGLSGKKIKKALHTCDGFNIQMYQYGRKLFGDDWMNQDDEFNLRMFKYLQLHILQHFDGFFRFCN